jgi:hypothetical protein
MAHDPWSVVGAISSVLSVLAIITVATFYIRDEYLEVKNSSSVADAARTRIKHIRMTVLGASCLSQIMNLLEYGTYTEMGCEALNVLQDTCDVIARFALYMFFLHRFVIVSAAQLGTGDPSFRRAIMDRKCTMIPIIGVAVLASIFSLVETSIENQAYVSNSGACDSGLVPSSVVFLVLFVVCDLIVNLTLFRLFMKPLRVMIVDEPATNVNATAAERQQFAVLLDLVKRNKVACYATIASTIVINFIYLGYENDVFNGLYNILKPVDTLINCVAITYTYRRFGKMWSCQYEAENISVKEETRHVDP